MKWESFSASLDLSRQSKAYFEISLGGSDAPARRLRAHGWHLSNPLRTSLGPWACQEYIHQSKAEFSVAKHAYVISHSGWFSERTAAHLASGLPAVAQDTGFRDWLPSGAGLYSLGSPGEALAGVEAIEDRYKVPQPSGPFIERGVF